MSLRGRKDKVFQFFALNNVKDNPSEVLIPYYFSFNLETFKRNFDNIVRGPNLGLLDFQTVGN